MELIVFDLDGTLLNAESKISPYTRETLAMLHDRGIAYTVATGRTLHASRQLLDGHNFNLPQIYKNGVIIWQPQENAYSHSCLLSESEIRHVLDALISQEITPFIFTIEEGGRHAVYHPSLRTEAEIRLVEEMERNRRLPILPASELPPDAGITNISALGHELGIRHVAALVEAEEHLIAYMGTGIKIENVHWLDIHHSDGSKGAAIQQLRQDLGAERVLCFGDSDNDLSMFAQADECYAPANSIDEVKLAATSVIGHHDEDGIARFLRERFSL